MQLLLIRHGKAGDSDEWARTGQPDGMRPLTREGREEMDAVAAGLRTEVPILDVIATSPLVRAVQTADAVAESYPESARETIDALRPGASFDAFVDWLEGNEAGAVVAAVGHNPHLSDLAGWLAPDAADIDMKKGSALLLELSGAPRAGAAHLIWYRRAKELIALAE